MRTRSNFSAVVTKTRSNFSVLVEKTRSNFRNNMKYLKRKIDKFLAEWKLSDNRYPLIIKGARQIGKTESILHFAKENYDNVVYINFVENPKYKKITTDGYSPELIRKNISLLNSDVKFVEHKTLIVFDEMQEHPDIATSLKFFKIEGKYDVICSGSLLGINYQRIESNSVGHKLDYTMHSMDFEEYLWAKGYGEDVGESIFVHIDKHEPFSTLEHEVFLNLFRDYAILGGMPAIVSKFVESGNFESILDMQRQLVLDYKEDVRKYVQGIEQTRILNVFNRIPIQLGRDNKKFQISKVATGAKNKDYWGCIEWLADAGMVNICYCMNFPELPLRGNYDDSKYKLYFSDTGMLISLLDDEAQEDLRVNRNLGTYKGALYENLVAEALTKSGAELYYYKRQDSTLEEDFFMRTKSELVPVEVKSTNGTSKSLQSLIKGDKYADIHWGIKLAGSNIGYANDVLTLPYYCAFLLKRYLQAL